MKDNNNLKKKLKAYDSLLLIALQNNNHADVNFYNNEIESIKIRLNRRTANRKLNQKQFKKSHGHKMEIK